MCTRLRKYIYEYVRRKIHIDFFIETISKFYLRFIDYIFLIWTGTIDQLMKFKQQINKVPRPIKLDFNVSNKVINFLDTEVYKIHSGKLETKFYRKESDRQTYLHHYSEFQDSRDI